MRSRWSGVRAALLFAVIAAVVAAATAFLLADRYEASTSVSIAASSSLDVPANRSTTDRADPARSRRVLSALLRLAENPGTLDRAVSRAPRGTTRDTLTAAAVVEIAHDGRTLDVRATHEEEGTARALARSYAEALAWYRGQLDEQVAAGAIADVRRELRRARRADSTRAAVLEDRLRQLRSAARPAKVVRAEVEGATRVDRERASVLGAAALGLLAGLAAASFRTGVRFAARRTRRADRTADAAPLAAQLDASQADDGVQKSASETSLHRESDGAWRRRVAGFGVLAAALGVCVAAVPSTSSGGLVALTAAAIATPLLWNGARGRPLDILDPMVLFVGAYGVMFVVRPAYMLATDVTTYSVALIAVDISRTFEEMQTLGLLGAVGFAVGYIALSERRLPVAHGPADAAFVGSRAQYLRVAAVVLLAAGALGAVLRIRASGGLEVVLAGRSTEYFQAQVAASKYLLYAPILLIPGALLLFALWFHGRKPLDLLGFLLGCAIVAFTFGFTGGRIQLLPLVAAPVVYFYAATGRRPTMRMLLLAVLTALTASAVIGELRNADARKEHGVVAGLVSVAKDPGMVLEPLTIGQDAAEAPALAAALTVIPEPIGHTYGMATVGDLIVRWIPRSVWAGKPLPPRETILDEIWGEAYRTGAANPEFSVLGSWYMDGGALGVLLGMVLYGGAFAGLYRYLQARPGSQRAAFVFAVSLPLGARALRDSPTDVLAQAAFIVLPAAVALTVARRSARRWGRNKRPLTEYDGVASL